MKKRDLKNLALMGLTGGILVGQQASLEAVNPGSNYRETPWVMQNSCSSCSALSEHKCGGNGKCGSALPQHSCGGKCGGVTAYRDSNNCSGSGSCSGIIADNDSSTMDKDTYQSPESKQASDPSKEYDPNQGNMRYHLMTEQELLTELNPNGVRMYNSLDDQGKMLARRVASMMCQGTNECKGLNGCQTSTNTCAGKGNCKGTGKCAISDKNLAVKLVYNKMASKRARISE